MPKRSVALVFVHGLAKKPPPAKLAEIWSWGLGRDNPMPTVFAAPNPGISLRTHGVPSSFCYYADVFYGEEYETEFGSYYESNTAGMLEQEGLQQADDGLPSHPAVTPREQKFLQAFEAKLQSNLALSEEDKALPAGQESYEIAGLLPAAVRRAVIKKAAMEAYYFLFDKEFTRKDGKSFQVRAELRERLKARIKEAGELADKVVVVSHSMGTMLAYDVLRNCPDCGYVDALFTLGSPLGVKEVQDELAATAAGVDFPAEKVGAWFNFFDRLDPICGADPRFANDYAAVDGKSVVDIGESNWGAWRHTITHYFAGTKFRTTLAQALGIELNAN